MIQSFAKRVFFEVNKTLSKGAIDLLLAVIDIGLNGTIRHILVTTIVDMVLTGEQVNE